MNAFGVRTNTKEFKIKVYSYILNAIDSEVYDVETNTDTEKLQFLMDTFKKEYVYPDNLRRYGNYQEVMRQWIMGLPSVFNIEFRNHAILEIAKQWESLPENGTEKQEDAIIENWFNLIAAKTFSLMREHGIYV